MAKSKIERTYFGQVVHEIRELINMNVKEYSILIRTRESTVYGMEKGNLVPTDAQVEKIIALFGEYGYHVPELRILAKSQKEILRMNGQSQIKRIILTKINEEELSDADLDTLDIIITEFFKHRNFLKEKARQRKAKYDSKRIKNE